MNYFRGKIKADVIEQNAKKGGNMKITMKDIEALEGAVADEIEPFIIDGKCYDIGGASRNIIDLFTLFLTDHDIELTE